MHVLTEARSWRKPRASTATVEACTSRQRSKRTSAKRCASSRSDSEVVDRDVVVHELVAHGLPCSKLQSMGGAVMLPVVEAYGLKPPEL
jgi:hypothetical protein